MFSKVIGPGIFDFNSSSLPMNTNFDLYCSSTSGTRTGRSTNLMLTTSPPFTVFIDVFPSNLSPTTSAMILLTNEGNAINCIPVQMIVNETTKQVINRNNMLPSVTPIAAGGQIQIKNVFFTDPRSRYAIYCEDQISRDIRIDIPLNVFVNISIIQTQQQIQQQCSDLIKTSSDNQTLLYQSSSFYKNCDQGTKSQLITTAIDQILSDSKQSLDQFKQNSYSQQVIDMALDGIKQIANSIQNANLSDPAARQNISKVVTVLKFGIDQLIQNSGINKLEMKNTTVSAEHGQDDKDVNQNSQFSRRDAFKVMPLTMEKAVGLLNQVDKLLEPLANLSGVINATDGNVMMKKM